MKECLSASQSLTVYVSLPFNSMKVITCSLLPSSSVFSKVLECGEEKILTLTEVERFKALAAQFVKLLRSQKDNCLMMTDLLTEYAKTFGYTFRLQDYDVSSISALTQKLCHVVKVSRVLFLWTTICGGIIIARMLTCASHVSVHTWHYLLLHRQCFICH